MQALTAAEWLAALILELFGEGGVSLTDASVFLEEINRPEASSVSRIATRASLPLTI